jgi:hypothetical protein
MGIFSLFLINNEGTLTAAAPAGVNFDHAFITEIYQAECQKTTPNPCVYDMGGGYSLFGLWSGEKPAIVLPKYIVGVVIDGNENQDEIKKHLRKITNNVLIKFQANPQDVQQYLEELFGLIENHQFESIVMEKPSPSALNSFPTPITPTPMESTPLTPKSSDISPTLVSESNIPTKPQNQFDDLMSLSTSTSISDGDSPNPFAANPFESNPFDGPAPVKKSYDVRDPFGGTYAATDPFGSTSNSSNPFGSPSVGSPSPNSIPKNPIVSNKAIPNPNISRKSLAKPVVVDEFSENPFADLEEISPSPAQADQFKEDPFANEPPKKKEIKKEEVDPFSDNPWG